MADNVQEMIEIFGECVEIYAQKSVDYGDSYKECGEIGLFIRLLDKIRRFLSISEKNIALVENEKAEDTLMDMINYCALTIRLIREGNTNVEN